MDVWGTMENTALYYWINERLLIVHVIKIRILLTPMSSGYPVLRTYVFSILCSSEILKKEIQLSSRPEPRRKAKSTYDKLQATLPVYKVRILENRRRNRRIPGMSIVQTSQRYSFVQKPEAFRNHVCMNR